ncbi:MerC domain-containing protein [Sphingosinithalassobacter portus]|uniref:MerC domain-containing protein n=1 Tax=Stakelama portus TaxID=2676234 RepID=UPI0013794711|nr:MerC domain-containing protein [Sphingosinithalassobacter portus]
MEVALFSPSLRRQDWIERIALGGSLLCLIHCLVLPLAIALLPALGDAAHLPHTTHRWLLAFVVPATGLALFSGLRRHRRFAPVVTGLIGIALLAIAAFPLLETRWETLLTVAGSLIIATAHLANWRMRHQSGPPARCDYAAPDEPQG